MNKYEFKKWILEEYPSVFTTHFAFELLDNLLEYAENMNENMQYKYLCRMIPQVPESIIRTVHY